MSHATLLAGLSCQRVLACWNTVGIRPFHRDASDYRVRRQLGRGAFCQAYKGLNKRTKEAVVIKALNTYSDWRVRGCLAGRVAGCGWLLGVEAIMVTSVAMACGENVGLGREKRGLQD